MFMVSYNKWYSDFQNLLAAANRSLWNTFRIRCASVYNHSKDTVNEP
jgi:hypothetical protein